MEGVIRQAGGGSASRVLSGKISALQRLARGRLRVLHVPGVRSCFVGFWSTGALSLGHL
jgi:hypothetical protein